MQPSTHAPLLQPAIPFTPYAPPPANAGWSGSRRSFDRNAPALAAGACRVLSLDQRHHGGSAATAGGRHVARLAADLRDVLTQLQVRAWAR